MDKKLSTSKRSVSSSSTSPKYKNKSIRVKNFLNNSINSLVTGVKKSFNKPNKNDDGIRRDQSIEKSVFNQIDDESDFTKIDVKSQLLRGKCVSIKFFSLLRVYLH
jgi:hypothetical protein